MAFTTYKPGQGYWTRLLSGIAAGSMALWGVYWLCQDQLGRYDFPHRVLVQGIAATVLILGLGGLIWWLLNKPRIVEFMIATEAEMRKVNWPTRREIIGSTWVVICGTAMMSLLLFLVNYGFLRFFQMIKITPG